MQLKKLQENFLEAVLKGDNKKLLPEIKDLSVDSAVLIEIYNNNTYSFLSNALKLTYPAVFNIMGEEKVFELASLFIKENPSTSGNLDDYGEGFYKILSARVDCLAIERSSRLARTPVLASKDSLDENILGDIAKFEWLYHKSANADKDIYFDLTKFAEVSPEQYENLKLSTQNSFNIFSSQFSVLKLWQENTGQPITAEGATKIIMIRPHLEIEIYKLNDDEFAFVQELHKGKDLLSAFIKAEKLNQDFDMNSALSKNLRRNIFKNFYL